MAQLAISLFDSKFDKAPKVRNVTTDELAVMVTTFEVRRQKDGPAWSPARYPSGAERGRQNVAEVCCLVFDLDDGSTPEDYAELWAPFEHIVHSSFHNQTQKDKEPARCRFRVAFPLREPVYGDKWGSFWRRANEHLAKGRSDAACKDASRLYYLPAHPPEGASEAFAYRHEGRPLSEQDLPGEESPAPRLLADERDTEAPGDVFNRTATLAEILEPHGWKPYNAGTCEECWTRPGKDPADGLSLKAVVSNNGTRGAYVFTSNAPPLESGTFYTLFGLYTALNHEGDHSAAARSLASMSRDGVAVGFGVEQTDSPFLTSTLYRESGKARNRRFQLKSLGQLMDEPEEETEWVVEGMLPMGGFALLAAKPKVGKSTLMRNLLVSVARGERFLGRQCAQGKVLYFGLEEISSKVAGHFRRMGCEVDPLIRESVRVYLGPADHKQALRELEEVIAEERPLLVVIDPLFLFVRVSDASAYAEVSNKLEPVRVLARETGTHILTTHHMSKADRDAGDGVLGSTAIFGGVDTLMEMRIGPNGRTLATIQRYGENLEDTVINLDPATGIVFEGGTVAAVRQDTTRTDILRALELGPRTEQEIKDSARADNKAVGETLRQMVRSGELTKSGKGRKGDPYVYALHIPYAPSEVDDEPCYVELEL